jgi:DUF4097 and DUF4098 domain-containing protein YvlB
MERSIFKILPALCLGLLLIPTVGLQAQRVVADDEWCNDAGTGDSRDERFCEVREYTLDPRGLVQVDAAPNGGISVEGWDRNEISMRVMVQAWSRRGDPAEIASDIEIRTGNTIGADGPRMGSREGWSVSFRLMVPRESDLDLESNNGGIRIVGVNGDMDFSTLNGGINLEDVGGDVKGRTTNGGVDIHLAGSQWNGTGLDVVTTNGGVTLRIPEDYRATLTTGTVNGGFETDFPITIQGQLRSRSITTDLNGGGPAIKVSTTNGGVRIRAG